MLLCGENGMFNNLGQQIYNTLVANDRWTMFLDGLLVPLMIAGIANLAISLPIGSVASGFCAVLFIVSVIVSFPSLDAFVPIDILVQMC